MPETETVCAACGTVIAGSTESFEPVGEGAVDASVVGGESVEFPVLIVRKGHQPGERFYIERDALTIGRDPESDIFLNDMTVSRSHASLHRVGAGVSVRDEGSLNGTYVNGVCVDSALLGHGDVLQIGTFQMAYLEGTVGGGR